MKATGIVRRIDDLGRVVIPKEIRRTLRIREGEPLLIDMDTLAVGHPILELGSTFNAYVGFSELDKTVIEAFLGIDSETAHRFWRLSLARYLGTDDENAIDNVENKAKVIGYMRLLRRCLRRDGDEVTVNHYRTKLTEVLDKVDTLVF